MLQMKLPNAIENKTLNSDVNQDYDNISLNEGACYITNVS